VGEGSALAVLTFIIVMAVSFMYIRFIGGNLKTMAEE
jgi:multiple sugar transport system permease protein